jgi:L-alanine-DL-glutamate epimerase-like enolase superfamily enzyme
MEDGHLLLPNRPGHGYEIAQAARWEYEIDPTL